MGCDIHLVAEVRNMGVWTPAQSIHTDEEGLSEVAGGELYEGRNYDLFAILADVRNGYGFAGIRTGGGFNPISDPRGIPEDCHPNTRKYLESYGGDGHSHSYHTVQQLLEYDWTQWTTLSGVLSAAEFHKWNKWARRRGESPDGWCGDVGGPGVQIVNEAEMVRALGNVDEDEISTALKGLYVRCEWEQRYYQCCSEFLSQTMPRLWALGKPEKVRILFFFDN